ncbi:MAG: nicotinate-nucleotide adenylyltransferase [Bacteroidota bacterium]|nr:nicotinate-nucleotide adenylyltransferase [Bacteroidota bacterium]MDP4231039.1 nicotinate-nucleotide adenylyltransferase [Bacteroidota bacterium]MDP4234985.1 nicotinate-nucleotide adenylyltransferase [Bacteroidota bacterium]
MKVDKLGIFGGTFDPPHLGHLIEAEFAAEELGLDKLIFIPTGEHPLKSYSGMASAQDRLEMTKCAIEGNPLFEVSDIEIKREGKSYTINTIEQVKKIYSPKELYLLVGIDNVEIFSQWHRIDEILDSCKVVVLSRMVNNDFILSPAVLEKITILDSPIIEISSTEIRELAQEGNSIRYIVPESVREYIASKGLYAAA